MKFISQTTYIGKKKGLNKKKKKDLSKISSLRSHHALKHVILYEQVSNLTDFESV